MRQCAVLGVFSALACLAGPSLAAAMTFHRIDAAAFCATDPCVVASGEIDQDTAEEFTDFITIADVPSGATVMFDSPGGSLLAGLALGRAIRRAGFYTAVGRYDSDNERLKNGGRCASACAYAFLGGVQRGVGRHARLGVHQFANRQDAQKPISVGEARLLTAAVERYTEQMVGKAAILNLAAGTPPWRTYWLSSDELRAHHVVTD